MSDKVRLELIGGVPTPAFAEDTLENALKAGVLRESLSMGTEIQRLLQEARTAHNLPVQWAGNEISLELHSDHAVITHQWVGDKEGNDAELSISIDELNQLVNDWETLLSAHRTSN